MNSIWQGLLANLSAVALCLAVWTHLFDTLEQMRRPWRDLIIGMIMGLGAVGTMLLGFELAPGVFVDLRGALIVNVALFASPVASLIALMLTMLFRFAAGGDGLMPGLLSIIMAFAAGFALRRWRPNQQVTTKLVVLSSALAALITLLPLAMLPASEHPLASAVPLAMMLFVASLVAGLGLEQAFREAAKAHVLKAALQQSFDYHYVKDRAGRLLAVNQAFASVHGFSGPDAMIGLTDPDLHDPARAAALIQQEREVLEKGVALRDLEERITLPGGERWFITTKVPLYDNDGNIIGIAGTTRDITERKTLEHELRMSRDTLSTALSEMSDGLALFDPSGYLILCNEQYRGLFPLTADIRRPGVHVRAILQATIDSGERVFPAGIDRARWLDDAVANLHSDHVDEVPLVDGRILCIRTRVTSRGDALVVITDETEARESAGALKRLNAELARLASTDALTRLANRRTFDEVMAREVARAQQGDTVMSVLMIDVDNFKAFNDIYGHQAGDRCLARLAASLSTVLRRPSDLAARYGGEEFAVVLARTDELGAVEVANRVIDAVRALDIPHQGSASGRVSISIGVASCGGDAVVCDTDLLVKNADAALYKAKQAGRGRVVRASLLADVA